MEYLNKKNLYKSKYIIDCLNKNNSYNFNSLKIVRIPRLFGGFYAPEKRYKYQVAILQNGLQICGGSIILNQWILTAAHCLE